MPKLFELYNIVSTEFQKLKNCKILWAIPTIFVIPNFLVFLIYAINPKYPIVVWNDYLLTPVMLINLLVGIGFFALLTGFIFSREYQEHMINNLFTYPISRSNFFVGKLIVMFLIISVTLSSSFVLSLLSGAILKHEPLTTVVVIKYLKAYILMVIMHFALVPIVAQLSISKRNIIPPIILGICAMVLNLIILNTPFNTIFPWTIPVIFSPHEGGRSFINYPLGTFTLLVTFVIGIAMSLKSLKRDVH
ncbi:ABC transporter permease [Desulfosporosinus lacus]|uniref:Bacitracin transport system permease protein n=1 Tax=Desulfosporosinus lacus DSM 15449 TaxID=1121420 RepID=A0A1M6B8M7_9FIRM|nr:ABC transporter permease [Desulfosporosinus lacus]SHI45104.1 bacitracin transport system permease protein [Desulfosporosinus lacus DSM 15449]